jgi:hypothetical protein
VHDDRFYGQYASKRICYGDRSTSDTAGGSSASVLSIAVWPLGEIRTVLTNDVPRQQGVVVVTFEEFEGTVLKLREQVLGGKLMPTSEYEKELGKLIYALALRISQQKR